MEKIEAPNLAVVFGEAVQRRRSELGWSQGTLAGFARQHGLYRWTRATVASTEVGRRMPTLEEALCLALMLERPLAEFFGGDSIVAVGDQDGIPEGLAHLGLAAFRAVINGSRTALRRAVREYSEVSLNVAEWLMDPASDKVLPEHRKDREAEAADRVAQLVDVPPDDVIALADELWGRPWGEENLRRTAERSRGKSARSVGVIRGHVTREMRSELQSAYRARRSD